MENLFKLLNLTTDEMSYFLGLIVGNADANPDKTVGEVVAEAFAEIESIRNGVSIESVIEALFGPAPAEGDDLA